MDIHNLLNYPAEQVVAYIPNIYDVVDHREKSSNIATEEADEGDDDSQKHSKIIPANAQKILQTLETFWMQQDEDSQEFVCTLQRMRDKIYKSRVNQTVLQDIRHFFSREETRWLLS